jgi:hypothetical protein
MFKPESYSMILYKQIYDSYGLDEFSDFDNFINIYSELNFDLNIIYSTYDELAIIKPENLNKIQSKFKLYSLYGKHEPFSPLNTTYLQNNFFTLFDELLKN